MAKTQVQLAEGNHTTPHCSRSIYTVVTEGNHTTPHCSHSIYTGVTEGNHTTPHCSRSIYTGVTVESAKGKCASCKVQSYNQRNLMLSQQLHHYRNKHRSGLRHFPIHQTQLRCICLLIFFAVFYFHLLIIS